MISIKELTKKYADKVVLKKLSFIPVENGITCILGKTGVGKTTLLNCIAGLTDYEGEIACGKVAYVFQEHRLIPNITLMQNLRYVLDKSVSDEKITDMLKEFDLLQYKDKYPSELSGGTLQRASFVRAFLYDTDNVLLDEPFRSLDVGTQRMVKDYFIKALSIHPKTVIMVSHDLDESLYLADRIVVLGDNGKIVFQKENPIPKEKRQYVTNSDLKKELIDLLK